MNINRNDFINVRDEIVDSYNNCGVKNKRALLACVMAALAYDSSVLAVVCELGSVTTRSFNGAHNLYDYAVDLMCDYLHDTVHVTVNGY